MDNINSFMSMFNILIGVLCGYSAIAGKGFAYKNDYPKEIQEEYCKMLRLTMAVIAPFALFMGIEEYCSLFSDRISMIVQLSLTALIFVIVVAFIVWFRVKFGKIVDRQNGRSLRR